MVIVASTDADGYTFYIYTYYSYFMILRQCGCLNGIAHTILTFLNYEHFRMQHTREQRAQGLTPLYFLKHILMKVED